MNVAAGRYSESRVVLITGAGGGLGRALVSGFREMGARLVLSDINDRVLAGAAEGDDASRVISIPADLRQVSEARGLVRSALDAFGRLDVVVNNAGLLIREEIAEVSEASFDEQVSVNLRAGFFICQAAVPAMAERDWGRIVNISSVGARTGGITDATAYSAAKAGVIAFTKSFARESARRNVLVNAVAPGAMDTRMMELPDDQRANVIGRTPLGRFADPAEVAGIVLWLASESNTYATGATFDINGGQVMV